MEIKQPKDGSFLNDFEKKHIPEVKLPRTIRLGKEIKIKVQVGEMVHPMIPEHYIIWVALYRGEELIQKNQLAPGNQPETVFLYQVTGGEELRCLAECNIHGIWEKKFEIKISKVKK
ncbi:MAG: desulfoferrodoxin family protein [Patescibacteria group bacterium]|jgi:superoxide reductase